MYKRDEGLDRLHLIYSKLSKTEKEKIIRLAEVLLNSQNFLNEEKQIFKDEKKEDDNKNKYLPLIFPGGIKVHEFKLTKPKK